MVKENTYIVIQSFMINQLNLRDRELLIYALIYGFCQNGEDWFTGSLSYISNWIGVGRTHVGKYLTSLIDKGLLEKREVVRNNVKFCEYRTVTPANVEGCNQNGNTITDIVTGCNENSNKGITNSVTGGVTTAVTNNTNINKTREISIINNNIVDVNENIPVSDLTASEKEIFDIKVANDKQLIAKYPKYVPLMKDLSLQVLRFMMVYSPDIIIKAQNLLYSCLKSSKIDGREVSLEDAHNLLEQAVQLCDPDEENDVYKSNEAYFIGIINNTIK